MLSLLTSRFGIIAIAALLIAGGGWYSHARIEGLTANRDAWKTNAKGWEAYGKAEHAAFAESERLRAVADKRAVSALDEAQSACTARVARARASAAAIRSIVTKPVKLDAVNCPVREVVGSDELRRAIGGG